MKDIKKITPQVWLRRAVLVVLDAALILFSFYFALLLRADGAVEAAPQGAGLFAFLKVRMDDNHLESDLLFGFQG